MTVTTARRSEIVQDLRTLRLFDLLSAKSVQALSDAILIIEGEGIPFDEIGTLPSARRTDPDTSHEFKLKVGDAHFYFLQAYLHRVDGLTPDECAQFWLMEPGPGPRKRISELKRAGMLADTGVRRPSSLGRPQQVLRITEHGQREFTRIYNTPRPA